MSVITSHSSRTYPPVRGLGKSMPFTVVTVVAESIKFTPARTEFLGLSSSPSEGSWRHFHTRLSPLFFFKPCYIIRRFMYTTQGNFCYFIQKTPGKCCCLKQLTISHLAYARSIKTSFLQRLDLADMSLPAAHFTWTDVPKHRPTLNPRLLALPRCLAPLVSPRKTLTKKNFWMH